MVNHSTRNFYEIKRRNSTYTLFARNSKHSESRRGLYYQANLKEWQLIFLHDSKDYPDKKGLFIKSEGLKKHIYFI